jgi:predicted neuraminidase
MLNCWDTPRLARTMFLAALMFQGGCFDWFPPSLTGSLQTVVFNDPGLAPVEPVVPHEEPLFDRRPVFATVPGMAGSHAAAVTAFEDGELLAAWYSYTGPHELTGSAIYMARRTAGQAEWGEVWMHIDRPLGDGNPALYSEGERVWLFQAVVPGLWSTARIEMQVSTDRGRTWSEPVRLPGPIGANVRFPPVRTANGSLLLPAYDDLLQRALFYTSPDGMAWTMLGAVSANPPAIQPSVTRLPDGRLLSVMRNTAGGWLWVMASDDGGKTWSAPQDSNFDSPAGPAAILQLTSGNLLLVFNDSPTERVRLTAALSADYGATWPARRVLADGPQKTSYPFVTQTPDGSLHILFSWGRERIEHIACNEAWILLGEAGSE